LAQELIRQDTVNPPGNEIRCIAIVADRLAAAGFAVDVRPLGEGRANLVARIGQGDAPLAFTGHVDTVPLGARPWSMDPFGAAVVGDKLFGRGASDMKAGIAAFTTACIRHAAALKGRPGVLILVTAAEETGTEGAFALARSGSLPPAGALVVAEPTANYPYVGHKGALWLRLLAEGVTAHGSMPERGINAVAKAARAVARLGEFDFNEKRHAVLGAPTLNVGTFHGGININSVPDRAEVGVDIRTIPGQKHAGVIDAVTRFLGGEVAASAIMDVEGVWTDPSHPWIGRVFGIMGELLGQPVEARGATYFTDASALVPAMGHLPAVILGPGEPAMAHQTDEYCLVSRIDQAVDAYGRIIMDWSAR
jgi:succinyl-diaminopimelate desuccinylase